MILLKCKMCGGDLQYETGDTVCECEYCGSKQTIPVVDDEKKGQLYERANRLRSNCEFDKAATVYESIVKDYPSDAESYWGLLLCKYGIEYVDDPATGNKVPTCHRSSFDSIMDDPDFEVIMENADDNARLVYREQAKQIESIRKGIIEVSGKEEPYDIFICYKETAEDGQRTTDSVIAQDVYDKLTEKGYRVFFSRITLEDKLGTEYEPFIFAALNSAKLMLAFGTSYNYYNAVWVKNEWSRYLKLMAKDKSKHLIPCYKDIDAYDMPKEFKHLQAQDMGKVGAVQDLLRGIDKILDYDSLKSKQVNIVDEKVLKQQGFDYGYEQEMGRLKAREQYEEKQRREQEERERKEREDKERRERLERERREQEENRRRQAEQEFRENERREIKKQSSILTIVLVISILVAFIVAGSSLSNTPIGASYPTGSYMAMFLMFMSMAFTIMSAVKAYKKLNKGSIAYIIMAFIGMTSVGGNFLLLAVGIFTYIQSKKLMSLVDG